MKLTPDIFEVLKKPTTIYHYTTSNIALENILPFSTLRMNFLRNTNDPREYKKFYFNSVGWGNFNDSNDKIGQAMRKIDNLRRNEFQVVSFSCNKEELYQNPSLPTYKQEGLLGCCKSRMWSQYGDNHKGIVLAFDSEKLKNTLVNQLNYQFKVLSDKMSYELVNIKEQLILDNNKIINSEIEDYCTKYIFENSNLIFFNKNPDYQDEDEYRIIIKSPNSNNVYLDIKDSLLAVLIGDMFPDGLLPSLKYLSSKLNVECKRVYWEAGIPLLFDCKPLDLELNKDWNDI